MAGSRNNTSSLGASENGCPASADFDTNNNNCSTATSIFNTIEAANIIKPFGLVPRAVIRHRVSQDSGTNPGSGNCPVPEALYDKARDHQESLTLEERNHLLSRGDLIGKALASPKSLNTEEIYKVVLWPNPKQVRLNIIRVSRGRFGDPSELFAKIKTALHCGKLEMALRDEELVLPLRNFHASDDDTFDFGHVFETMLIPEVSQAIALVGPRVGLDAEICHVAMLYRTGRLQVPSPFTASHRTPMATASQPKSDPKAVNTITNGTDGVQLKIKSVNMSRRKIGVLNRSSRAACQSISDLSRPPNPDHARPSPPANLTSVPRCPPSPPTGNPIPRSRSEQAQSTPRSDLAQETINRWRRRTPEEEARYVASELRRVNRYHLVHPIGGNDSPVSMSRHEMLVREVARDEAEADWISSVTEFLAASPNGIRQHLESSEENGGGDSSWMDGMSSPDRHL